MQNVMQIATNAGHTTQNDGQTAVFKNPHDVLIHLCSLITQWRARVNFESQVLF